MKSFGWINSLVLGVILSAILFLQTHLLIPFLSSTTNLESVIFWFIVAGLGMFLPMILYGIYILKNEGLELSKNTFKSRLRFSKMTKQDWLVTLYSFTAIGFLSFVFMELLKLFFNNVSHQPSFMYFEPLTPDRYWILLLWLPYWLLNILGEEFFWRGVILPKQNISGKFGWVMNSVAWGLFHLSFGFNLMITLLPILIILPFAVNRQKNSWIGVILHAGLNGPSFLAISFGLI